jgi:hypothetical protein
MTDRELLEAAAKAAGMLPAPAGVDCAEGGPMSKGGLVFSGNGDCIDWNPLTDDGDAFRLAVKLRIKSRYNEALGQGLAWINGDHAGSTANTEDCGRDECATLRRAIVIAAAEIGASK